MTIFFLFPRSLLLSFLFLTSRLAMKEYPRLFLILHTSITGDFTMVLLFLLLPFLPTFYLSVTKAILENSGPDIDKVKHFKNLDMSPEL